MIRRDCIHYHCEHDMGASIDCCTLRGLGNCPCSNDCNDYANKNKIYLLGLDVFRKRKEASAQPEPCDVCENLEEGDTLYSRSELDGGIGYDYIRDIQFCPKCGRRLKHE